MSLGLALSGGGAKGIAHIGVLQALKEENIKIDYISGTSMGSLVSSLYCSGYEPNEILNIINRYCNEIINIDKKNYLKTISTMLNSTTPVSGIASGYDFKRVLYNYFLNKGVRNIYDFSIPLAIPTVDLYSGKIIYFLSRKIDNSRILEENEYYEDSIYEYSESIVHIVKSSCSFPGLFEPEIYRNYMLVDGGLRKNVPVSILKKMGAEKVLAICFNKSNSLKDSSILTVALKCIDIMGEDVSKYEINQADLIITPDINNLGLIDFKNCNYIANQGYKKTKEMMPKIKELINT